MIYDPKQLNENRTPPPPTDCPCGRPFEPEDQIVADTDPTLGVTTYWHRACLTGHIDTLLVESERRSKEFEEALAHEHPEAARTIARMRAALRGEP
jgi:hypothetical protein